MRDASASCRAPPRLGWSWSSSCSALLGLATDLFLTVGNLVDPVNVNAINVIFAVGLLVVLVTGGIDISFAVAAFGRPIPDRAHLRVPGRGELGLAVRGVDVRFRLGAINASLIYYFRIISIVVTIATFSLFFGVLMFLTGGVSIYDLPDWWVSRVDLLEYEMPLASSSR